MRPAVRPRTVAVLSAVLSLVALLFAQPALARFTPPPLTGHVVDTAGKLAPPLYWLTAAGAAGMLLGIFYAGVELRWRSTAQEKFQNVRRSTTLLLLGVAITLVVAGIALLPELGPAAPKPRHSAPLVVVMLLTLALLVWRLKLTRDFSRDRSRHGPEAALGRLQSGKQKGVFGFALLVLAAALVACLGAGGIPAVRFAHPSGTARIAKMLTSGSMPLSSRTSDGCRFASCADTAGNRAWNPKPSRLNAAAPAADARSARRRRIRRGEVTGCRLSGWGGPCTE